MNEKQAANLLKGQEALRRSKLQVIDTKNIVASNLQDYTKQVIVAALEGFETNELNIYFARSSIGVYAVTLVKYAPPKEAVKITDKPEVQELLEKIGADAEDQVGAAIPVEAPKAKRGPKGKGVEA